MDLEFIESPIFSKIIYDYLTEEEYMALQWFLSTSPDAGNVIPGSGGLRKLRWKTVGRGKRGGIRTIYYHKNQKQKIIFITAYAKNEAETIPAHILKKIKEEMTDD